MDVRIPIIEERLKGIKRIIGVTAGKGGVGKSSLCSLLSLSLAERGKEVGLFDLDLSCPSAHIILGFWDLKVKEERGIIPPSKNGIKFMSPVLFSEYDPLPFRGQDISNSIIELLSTTLWGEIDFLLIDMPPGTSDTILDVIRFLKNIEFIVVFTPSPLSFSTVKRHVELIRRAGLPVACFVENLKREGNLFEYERIFGLSIPFLFSIPYDRTFEAAIGDEKKLKKTVFFREVERIAHFLLQKGLKEKG